MVASVQSLVFEYSSIVLTVLIFIMTGCQCQDSDPCPASIKRTEPWRDVTVPNDQDESKKCDKDRFQTEQWYSFQIDNQPAMIPTTCVQSHRCGATIAMRIHLDGQAMPQPGEYVTATLCGSYNVLGKYDCCVLRSSVTIYKCKNSDYVYQFHSPIDRCSAAICTQKIHQEVPENVTAVMGDPHPDQLNNIASGNDEDAFPADNMIREDEIPVEAGNNTEHQTEVNGTQYPSSEGSEINLSPQDISNTTGITLGGIFSTNAAPRERDNESNNGNDTTSVNIDNSVITTISNQLTSLPSNQTHGTLTPSTATEKEEISMSTNTLDVSTKDHRSPLTSTMNSTIDTDQPIAKNDTPAVNTTSNTPKDSLETEESTTLNATSPRSSSSSASPSASPSPPPHVPNSSSPSTTVLSTASASSSTTPPTSTSTSTVSIITTTSSTTTTAASTTASVTSASTTNPPTSSSSSSSSSTTSMPPTILPLSTSESSSSFLITTLEPTVSSSPSPSSHSPSTTLSTSPPTQPPTHEVMMTETIRLVLLGAFWDGSFIQKVENLLFSFLSQEMDQREADDSNLDTWYDITESSAVVEDRNETTHVDIRISHSWPYSVLDLFETTDFADYLYDKGNVTLLVACRPRSACHPTNDTFYTFPTVPSSHKTPPSSSSLTFDKNFPVLVGTTTLLALCLIVMVIGVICAKCRKRRSSHNTGNDAEKKSLGDKQPNCEGTPSPFTDNQIMSDEEAADGSANLSAVDGGETIQDNSWVVPLEDIELEEKNQEVVAEATEDTKF